jgi:excinuclease ABC subunit C
VKTTSFKDEYSFDTPKYTPDQVKHFPDKPGVYRFYNDQDEIIYVGKAKNLKNRVSSYFADKAGHNRKTLRMVYEIQHIQFTIVNTEFDALLLENNLIKKNQPKYNILLKDDKTFPYICVANERFPRIYSTRRIQRHKGKYYGPYASVRAMKSVLELIRNLYHIRTCKYDLSEENINKGKFKICLEYHIGKCKGPCENLQSEEEYMKDIAQATEILKGNLAPVRQHFREEMQSAAEKLEFERAQNMKEKLNLLEKFQSKSIVANPSITNTDVFGIVSDQKCAFISYLRIVNGAIVLSETIEVKKKLEEDDAELLTQMVIELREKFRSNSIQVLTNVPLTFELNVQSAVPKIGDKKHLVDLAIKNALYYKKERLSRVDPDYYREKRILKQLQEDMRLQNLPEHIECFDNSNLQGSNPVASMVCFKKGKPSKKDYRKYHIKTVTGANDFASMKEVALRRYKRLLDEEQPLPDLIVIDGGKGQLNFAVQALKELDIYGEIAIVGIAKKLEEIYYPGDEFPLHINKKSESLKLIQRLRNEAHRFAITFHRQTRSKNTFATQLTNIPGIGGKTAEKLLKKFRSVKKIKEASVTDLSVVVGVDKAQTILNALNNETQ